MEILLIAIHNFLALLVHVSKMSVLGRELWVWNAM
jgi:hypothetical protein